MTFRLGLCAAGGAIPVVLTSWNLHVDKPSHLNDMMVTLSNTCCTKYLLIKYVHT